MNTGAVAPSTNNLHHPRPTMAGRSASSNNNVSNAPRPTIQYPVALVPRPSAPAPASPDIISTGGTFNYHSSTSLAPKRTGSTSPSINRRKQWSVDSSTPTYVDEHVIQHFDTPDFAPRKPAVLRQRSASTPDNIKANTVSPVPVRRSESPQKESPGNVGRGTVPAPRPANGNVHFTPGLSNQKTPYYIQLTGFSDNLFVSFTQSNTLIIHNLTPSNNGPNAIIESVRSDVMSLWPTGVRLDDERRGQWTIRFAGDIWKARLQAAIMYDSDSLQF
jgi:hypothetical protein